MAELIHNFLLVGNVIYQFKFNVYRYDFYDIFFKFFILQLQLRSTAEVQSFLGPNIRLRPKVKNVATVQHCKTGTPGFSDLTTAMDYNANSNQF